MADVHTSYNSNQALEEATGYPAGPVRGLRARRQMQLLAGAAYAYYEFTVPLDKRLTDEEWVALLDSGQAPSRPAWTDEWIVGDYATRRSPRENRRAAGGEPQLKGDRFRFRSQYFQQGVARSPYDLVFLALQPGGDRASTPMIDLHQVSPE